jgi:alkylated DNA nucleotide flippase Atl1
MKAEETRFAALMAGAKQFRVPLYQRTYSWTERQWQSLWDAVLEQAQDLAAGGGHGPGHFLGSVVLAPAPGVPALPQWVVIDGQQRLTTLSLALAALSEHLRGSDDRTAGYVQEEYLVNRREKGEQRYKLLPTQSDRAAYIACVDGTPLAGDGGNIGEAYRFFQRKIAEYDDPDDAEDAAHLEQALTSRLELVQIAADRDDNVHRIFESLNNTGMRLSQADLLRNYVFMLLPTRGEKIYNAYWRPMHDALGGDGMELLAWLDLVIRGDERVKRTDVYRMQQQRLSQHEQSRDEAAVEAEVVELARRARLLGVVLKPVGESDSGVRRRLERLAEWDATTTYPVLLWLMDARDGGHCGSAELAEALGYIESFLVRRILCGYATNNLNRIFATLPQELDPQRGVAADLRRALSTRRRYWAGDDELRAAVGRRNFYWTGRRGQQNYILRRLEEDFAKRERIDWEAAAVTIEHVLPQSPTAEWLSVLTEEVDAGETPEELHAALVHTLGNLTLTAYNPELSNQPFPAKRKLLADSGLAMNRAIAQEERWGRAEIAQRAADLADRAVRIWPAPLPSGVQVDPELPAWRLLRQALAALPAGAWTTYGALAEVCGTHAVPLGNYIAEHEAPNAWRVLRRDGTVSPGFRWIDPTRKDDPYDVLRAEGVRFDEQGRADPGQRVSASELADMLGLDQGAPAPSVEPVGGARAAQFSDQLRQSQPPEVVDAVESLLRSWRQLGGRVEFGSSQETSAFLMLRGLAGERPDVWPWAIYPRTGTVEVVFQYLKTREPFVETTAREEFRQRMNEIPGVDLPGAKLGLRPSLPLQRLVGPEAQEAAESALEWFAFFAARGGARDAA